MIHFLPDLLKRRYLGIAATLVIMVGLAPAFLRLRPPPVPAQAAATEDLVEPLPEPEPQTLERVEILQPNATLQDILLEAGLSHQDIYNLVKATEPVYNLHRLRAGNKLTLETDSEGTFIGLRYEISEAEFLRASFDGQGYLAERITYPVETRLIGLAGQIQQSLWQAILDLGEDPRLVAGLSDILQWDVDFTILQPGDWFKVLVEKRFREGQFISYGTLHAVELHTSGNDYRGFFFQEPDKPGRHFDEKGTALRKAFLKIPFTYSPRISSGFSYARFHPILKTRRPHPAIDFAAPHGTPVLASGKGRVVHAGPKGGLGSFVQIRHPNGYKSGYAHLSKILVKTGQQVDQGQRIGRVGSTGLATAAHLDYRIWDDRGRYVNPRKKVSWPSAEAPVGKDNWDEFVLRRDLLLGELAQMPVEGFKGLADLLRTD